MTGFNHENPLFTHFLQLYPFKSFVLCRYLKKLNFYKKQMKIQMLMTDDEKFNHTHLSIWKK